MTDTQDRKALAAKIAEATETAYSWDRYRSWAGAAEGLLRMGLTEREVRGILRSKWTRWAADRCNRYGNIPAKAITDFVKSEMAQRPGATAAHIRSFAEAEEC